MESVMFSGVPQRQVEQFRQRYADVHLTTLECAMATLPRLIEQGRLDLGFVRSPMSLPPSLCAIPFLTEGFALALPKHSPLCTLDVINASGLQHETFIFAEQLSGTLEVAAQGGFSPILGPQLNSLMSVIARVSLGQGVAVVPNAVVDSLNLPGVVFRHIEDSQATSSLSLIHRRDERSPMATCFIELMDTYRDA
jgi:DNA-binding transcriptional LysR family regulator